MKNIRNINDILIFLLMVVTGCSEFMIKPSGSNYALADFDSAWNAIDRVYPLLEYKNINWNNVYVEYKDRASKSKGDEDYKLIYDLLRELKDPHVYFVSLGRGLIYPYPGPRLIRDYKTFNRSIISRYFDSPLLFACRGKIEYGIINNALGYIYISNFNDEGAMDDFGDMINNMRTTRGLILDIRNNQGGLTDNISVVIGKFITDSLTFIQGYVKGNIEYNIKAVQPDTSLAPYMEPIIILMNGSTLSSGEIFAEMMNQLKNVTLVGDTTDGAGCNDIADDIEGDYILPSGIRIHIGTTYGVRYDGTPIDINGILPDILITQSKEDMKDGRDIQLEFAIQYLLNN